MDSGAVRIESIKGKSRLTIHACRWRNGRNNGGPIEKGKLREAEQGIPWSAIPQKAVKPPTRGPPLIATFRQDRILGNRRQARGIMSSGQRKSRVQLGPFFSPWGGATWIAGAHFLAGRHAHGKAAANKATGRAEKRLIGDLLFGICGKLRPVGGFFCNFLARHC